ncbi:Homocysteine S-methyltransferase [Naematelia encephala]|uniref:Homocysteine S-methyltransferase n=1 Tax=Naematelia encephala TaxID=71784 RepID=A0A1Y2AEJ9_9TREE|nr:Homocysteine S-methyltransferase [Naematelia encephala]
MSTKPILLLDGGMGTTLESLGADVSNPLWGCQLVHSDPETISSVHRGFLDAGADIIETATYQMTLDLLVAQGHSVDQAKTIMRSAVHLADAQTKVTNRPKVVALSIGPLGATLQPGQEYAGNYPSPYGPFSPSTSISTSTSTSTSTPTSVSPPVPTPVSTFTATSTLTSTSTSSTSEFVTSTNQCPNPVEEDSAEEALTEFHLDRLRVFALHEPTWRTIEWIAFETIPLIREIKAIRRAMTRLKSELEITYGTKDGDGEIAYGTDNAGGEIIDGMENGQGEITFDSGDKHRDRKKEARRWYDKKFWITSAYPLGQHGTKSPNGQSVSTSTIVHSLLDPMIDGDTPNGVGINCTNPTYLSRLVHEFTQATTQSLQGTTAKMETEMDMDMDRPYFVLYPDGGNVYDVVTRQWSEGKLAPNDWAAGIASVVESLKNEDAWGGIIVGGCCKAGFNEIKALRTALDEIS